MFADDFQLFRSVHWSTIVKYTYMWMLYNDFGERQRVSIICEEGETTCSIPSFKNLYITNCCCLLLLQLLSAAQKIILENPFELFMGLLSDCVARTGPANSILHLNCSFLHNALTVKKLANLIIFVETSPCLWIFIKDL